MHRDEERCGLRPARTIVKIDSEFYKRILDNLFDGVYFVDTERRITFWNKGAERLTGFDRAEVLGSRCSDNVLMHVDQQGVSLCQNGCPVAKTLADGQTREAEVFLHHKLGHRVPVLIRVEPVRDETGAIIGAVEVFSQSCDNVATLQRVEELERMAYLDPLTGVGNRRSTEIILNTRLHELIRYGWPFAVVAIDLDNFKYVNDNYGHATGDDVLKMVARTLRHNCRSFDFVGRWGGDEFLLVLVNVTTDQLDSIANKLLLLVSQSSLRAPFDSVCVTISIGAALARPDDTIESLLKRADELLYRSKGAGGNRVTV